MGITDGHYCPLSTVRSTRGSVVFHYRADVPLGFFDPLHLREVWYSCASTQRVLVFYLPNRRFRAGKMEEKVKSRSQSETIAERQKYRNTTQHSTTNTEHGIKHTFFPEK